ncbi:MAG: class II aldolase/adducin family protein [Candidatus Sericytochromatia bacterium]|nr:class II aldolase/adducin family protein [Candidatus Sericytochromatia bacterium]
MIVAADGNVSARLGPDRILVTPTGVCKGFLAPEDLVVTDMDGVPVRSGVKCSTEIAMHVVCYRHRPDIKAVVHAHPPTAVAFSVAGRVLEPHVLPEVVVTLGIVPTLPYTDPGSYEVPDAVGPAIENCEALILEFHGALAVGDSVMSAYFKLEKVEHAAHILLMAHQLGGIRMLSREAILKLQETQKRVGITIGLPPAYRQGYTGAAEDLDQEALIAQVTAAVIRQLQAGSR